MTTPIELDDAALSAWPLPRPSHDDDKEARGRVLVIAGSAEMPGAAVLAGEAALRAGAGKLAVGAAATIAPWVAQQLPEARVIALPEDDDGGLRPDGLERLDKILAQTRAVLVGPGMPAGASTVRLVEALLDRLDGLPLLLDAAAMDVVSRTPGAVLRFSGRVAMTPHAGEMAHLSGEAKESIECDPGERVSIAAKTWGAAVALKGACTWIAAPDGRLWRHARGRGRAGRPCRRAHGARRTRRAGAGLGRGTACPGGGTARGPYRSSGLSRERAVRGGSLADGDAQLNRDDQPPPPGGGAWRSTVRLC
jgi:hydroxyethylthiazole kinase-like uncharacterized protein yjeF